VGAVEKRKGGRGGGLEQREGGEKEIGWNRGGGVEGDRKVGLGRSAGGDRDG